MMKEMDFSELSEWILEKKSDVERDILQTKGKERNIRTRARDENEVKILDDLCKKIEKSRSGRKSKILEQAGVVL
jgi:hypothetical protein